MMTIESSDPLCGTRSETAAKQYNFTSKVDPVVERDTKELEHMTNESKRVRSSQKCLYAERKPWLSTYVFKKNGHDNI